MVPYELEHASAELAAIANLTNPLLSAEERERAALALSETANALNDVRELASTVEQSVEQLVSSIAGLEALLLGRSSSKLGDCLVAATTLSNHATKLIGGVRWEPVEGDLRVLSPKGAVIAIVTAVLCELAALQSGHGIVGRVESGPHQVRLRVSRRNALEASIEKVLAKVMAFLDEQELVSVEPANDAIVVTFMRAFSP
jgi:hypothetical protein